MSEEKLVIVQERGSAGLITINRPKALNALSLEMIREITAALLRWHDAPHIQLVAIRGMGKQADGSFVPFGSFCAGGDIRFFHQAALAGDPALEDFFTEEYSLNHLIHTYPKPYLAFIDGICMGGGMGLCQGRASAAPYGEDDERANRASPVARPAIGAGVVRIVTERTKMAMPETNIGLFPDVGGGYFLSRCANSRPGIGEYLALTGQLLHAADAMALGLADVSLSSQDGASLWDRLDSGAYQAHSALISEIATNSIASSAHSVWADADFLSKVSQYFDQDTAVAILHALEGSPNAWEQAAAATLRKRSPLMLEVTLQLIRRARSMSLADDLRLERDLVRHCFHTQHLQRSGASSETVEGIRALAVDKDHSPKWSPAKLEDITHEMIAPFFVSPWPAAAHPLRGLL